jgi:hypothetical protein
MFAKGPSMTHPPPVPGGIKPVRGGLVGIVRLEALCGIETPLLPIEPSLPENSSLEPGVASFADQSQYGWPPVYPHSSRRAFS